MKQLQIIEREGRLLVDSREVAEMIGKRHDHLIRDIEGYKAVLDQNPDLGADQFFEESSYEAGTGKQYRCYLLTRIGCDMVANKMTGEKGVLFTAAYVTKFEEMEKQLRSNPPQMSQLEIVAHLALQAVQKEKEDARRDQELQSLKSGLNTLTENLTAIPDAAKVVDLVNEYARWTRIGHNEIYNRVYDIMKDQHGIDVPQKVKNEREKVNQAQIAAKGKPYAESTLKSKVNGIDVMVRNGWLEKFSVILASLLAQVKANALPEFEG